MCRRRTQRKIMIPTRVAASCGVFGTRMPIPQGRCQAPSCYSTTSRPFATPESGRIAVKVIKHYGDEVLKVFEV
jgi:hypothetical protein